MLDETDPTSGEPLASGSLPVILSPFGIPGILSRKHCSRHQGFLTGDTTLNINGLHARVVDGDEAATEQLFQQLSARFEIFVELRIGDKEDAAEVVQDALVTITSKYRDIVFESSFAAWAYGVLEHKLLHYYRSKGIKEKYFADNPAAVEAQAASSTDPTLIRRLLECLRKVSEVNSRFARILNLHYQGYSADEVCSNMRVTHSNYYALLSRARSHLKECIERN